MLCGALFFGCAKKQEETSLFAINPMTASATPQPVSDEGIQGLEVSVVSEPATPADPAEIPAPAITVSDTVAYVFDGTEGPTLYGAAAYENTGNCPVIITGAVLNFSLNGTSRAHDHTPIMNETAILLPGETGFLAWWDPDSSLSPDADVTLDVTAACRQADAERITVTPTGIYLADNYPSFTTMTGTLESDGECSLNLVYTGFYDANGKLLGVWFFTKNAPLSPDDSKNFAIHMKELPIDSLGEKTASIRTYGVGF